AREREVDRPLADPRLRGDVVDGHLPVAEPAEEAFGSVENALPMGAGGRHGLTNGEIRHRVSWEGRAASSSPSKLPVGDRALNSAAQEITTGMRSRWPMAAVG